MLFLKGIAVGVANVVPGVSGATLAVIFRVYHQLLDSINNIFTDMKNALKFLIPFGAGMAIGVLALGSLLDYFLSRFSLQSSALIAGLMAGSIPFMYKMATQKHGKKALYYVVALIGFVAVVSLSLFAPTGEIYTGYGFNVGLAIRLFIGGFLGAMAMIIPGMSGSIILILLGVFPLAMHTISLIREYLLTPTDFGLLPPILMVVVPVGIGVLLGVIVTSRLVAFLLEKHQSITYAVIIGLILGTVFAIFNNDSTYASYNGMTVGMVAIAVLVFFCGGAIALVLGKKE